MRRVLRALYAGGFHDVERWVEESPLAAAAFPGTEDVYYVRYRLKQLAAAGLLERCRSPELRGVLVASLSQAGENSLLAEYRRRGRATPRLTRPPRLDQSIHHLLVVAASINVLLAANARFTRLEGDEDLRSQSRQGRRLTAGAADVAIPDGRLTYRVPGEAATRRADIEILVSKYTDEQIKKKYAELLPSGTLFFAPTRRLCDRVEALVGRRPVLIV
ncbi:MAG TPA: hypothetical protein VF190_11370 [Rhodothermales bacterium]